MVRLTASDKGLSLSRSGFARPIKAMNILEILVDALTFVGPPRADQDRSIVGKSPMEEDVSSLWRRLAFVLVLAAASAAFFVWIR